MRGLLVFFISAIIAIGSGNFFVNPLRIGSCFPPVGIQLNRVQKGLMRYKEVEVIGKQVEVTKWSKSYRWWRICNTKRGESKALLVLDYLASQFLHQPVDVCLAGLFFSHPEVVSDSLGVVNNQPSPGAERLDPPSSPAQHQVHADESMCRKGT